VKTDVKQITLDGQSSDGVMVYIVFQGDEIISVWDNKHDAKQQVEAYTWQGRREVYYCERVMNPPHMREHVNGLITQQLAEKEQRKVEHKVARYLMGWDK